MNDRTNSGISPVYLLSKDLPEDPRVDNYELCIAISKVIGRGGLLGAQRIGALWRIYTQTLQARATILANGLVMRGRTVHVQGHNPFMIRGSDGEEIPGTKLIISEIPISFSNTALEAALIKKGLKLRSKLKMEEVRDREGKLTEWLSGRRFVFIDLPKCSIERVIDVGPFKAKLYYKEMQQANLCFKCNKPGHRAFECLERDGEDKGGEISDIRNNSRAQMDDTENEEPAKRLDEERMKGINETNTSPEEGGENARPGKKREEAKPEEEETDKSGKKKNKKKKSKNHKKDTQGEEIVSEEGSETSSPLSSEDGEERGLRDEEIEGEEMAEDEEEDLDEEEGKPGIDKEQKGEETQERKKTEKERGRPKGKSKEKDIRDYLARERSLSYKRAQPDTPVMNKGPSPRKARNEKRKE